MMGHGYSDGSYRRYLEARAARRAAVREFLVGVLQVLGVVLGSAAIVAFIVVCAVAGTWE